MTEFYRWSVWLALALGSSLAAAQSSPEKADDFQATLWGSSCMACHGTDGRADGTGLSIGGRHAEELYALLLAYKQGKRVGTIMDQHVKGYSDGELKRIAIYFSKLK